MRVLVTGGTGFVGAAVVRDLLGAGHEVLGLARSERSAARLAEVGAVPVPGSLEDLASLRAATGRADAVVHTAFDNSGPLRMRRSARVERAALGAMGDVLAGTGRPLVAAGGFAPVVQAGPVLTERDPVSPHAGAMGRNVERTLWRLADRDVNASVVRMPVVHGDGDRFTMPRFIALARRHGRSACVGDGANRLPAVHVDDAARLYRLAVERAVPRSRYHAVAQEGVPFREVAEVIGRRLDVPVVSVDGLAAVRAFGVYLGYARGDRPASSALTRAETGWAPEGPGLVEDLDRETYFPR